MPDGADPKAGLGPAALAVELGALAAALGRAAWKAAPGIWRVERESGASRAVAGLGPAGASPSVFVAGDADEILAAVRLLPTFAALAEAAALLQALRRTPAPADAKSHARLLFQAEAALEAELARIALAFDSGRGQAGG